jgi:hypothetical protein
VDQAGGQSVPQARFASPPSLAVGRFDAGFLIILLMPLFVLPLTYDVVAEERESGRLKLEMLSDVETGAASAATGNHGGETVFACLIVILGTTLAVGMDASVVSRGGDLHSPLGRHRPLHRGPTLPLGDARGHRRCDMADASRIRSIAYAGFSPEWGGLSRR